MQKLKLNLFYQLFFFKCYSGLHIFGDFQVAVAAQTAAGTGPYSIAPNLTIPINCKASFPSIFTLFFSRYQLYCTKDSCQLSKQVRAIVAGKSLDMLRRLKFLEPTHFWESLTNACTSLGWMAMASAFLEKCASIIMVNLVKKLGFYEF